MPKPTFKARVWAIRETASGTFELRWKVGNEPFSRTFKTKTQADGRRSQLVTAINDGVPFDEITGAPMPEVRAKADVSWYLHARDFAEMKWTDAPAKTRATIADMLATATPVLVSTRVGMPTAADLRSALYSWAFNVNRWTEEPPARVQKILTWVERQSMAMSELDDPLVMRKVLTAFARNLDGSKSSPHTVKRKRAIFNNALGYAVEARRLPGNPLSQVQWTAPKTTEAVDPAVVANPRQVRMLLAAVARQGKRGEHLKAFFGCLYHAGMRPAEVVWLRQSNCQLPASGFGLLTLSGTRPRVGSSWTDNGKPHDERGLKWRAESETRPIPIPPELVEMLREHINAHGVAPDGRLFRTNRGGLVQESGYGVVWQRARREAFAPEQVESPLATRPYDLRHAGISLWLNSGVDPAECARRAGHSIAVLLRVYAKCLDGAIEAANRRIADALNEWN
ncbi:tyrosine-type recombinase/integrase [Streptomyces sp. TLI_171]|uniref:tyrosine-type recombinase/integrase n=1 Tax=Streptomyces sp. TLI_171 TaxID=1938859 RepID=UPI000C193D5B|nr:tyrosine-type recombinase/integrase [Streptomyces sp. TLI_171]RKE19634.1 site-specific recombinase XerD [Streptomyces sp. TLI_171]